ncbi:hypothetical protein GCM10011371_19700 [Novosphingobium marinum]|uniref:Type VI secretion system protein ImpK n=1 Tax=Novosphingobium marinum TaxID=1514948 RepID=A0A7Y9XZD8_9SPHN|nr:type IVB secretion system protein IcmH/DotU [Novosphingobium marinum]NYH96083.1 type VI secretion system protein ImpK [Novosphingobium marinum]GGC32325.1 hypothetical protein GCM10011371_19700 [Novosphingobium marinum]
MSGDNNSGGGNRTVFRPSPLSGMRQGQQGGAGAAPPPPPPPPQNWGTGGYEPPPQFGTPQPPPPQAAPPQTPMFYDNPPPGFVGAGQNEAAFVQSQHRLNDEDIPTPKLARESRSLLVMEASAVLALAASVRSGRARISMPAFHKEASERIAAYDRAIAPAYPEEVRMRARYALCATVDDIAQNLPNIGQDGAEWARRSLVVMFFRENIGGDRFWQLVDQLLARPAENAELIELFADCLAAGFEGRFRVMPDGRARLQQIIHNLYGALEHPRSLSQQVISPHWKGADAPLNKVGLWNKVMLIAAATVAGLLLIYIILRLLLMASGSDPWDGINNITPSEPLRLSREGTAPPPSADSAQASRLKGFLEPEINEGLVVVEEDASTVRVRTTIGQLFESGSDQLEPGRAALFTRIGKAVEEEEGYVKVEGHADSDQIATLAFPDNTALSKARAETVAGIIRSEVSQPGRVSVEGYGDARPIATNETAEGKSKNRRVEVVVPRRR